MSTKGRAAILVEANQPLVVDEVEFPDPGADQILVKLFSSGICHSQIHTMRRPPRRRGCQRTRGEACERRRSRDNDVGRSE